MTRPTEQTLIRLSPLRAGLAITAAALATAACDRLPEAIIFPEFEFAFSFESGLAGWAVMSADMGQGTASMAGTDAQSSEGSRSVRVTMNNSEGAGKVWMTRELQATPDQSYSVDVSFKLRTLDHGTTEAWKVIVGVRDQPPTTASALDFQGETSSGVETATGPVWGDKGYTIAAKADDEGRLFLSLGVWGTTTGSREYFLDDVRVVLTRS